MTDLSRLKLFIDTLPENKVLPDQWTERYIEDINAMQGYDAAKSLANKRKRYVEFAQMIEYGYLLDPYETSCDEPPTEPNSCSSCCDYKTETEKCVYNEIKCNRFFAQNVKNWSELCGYHILFLQGKTPGTPHHPGPWNKETSYIIELLTRILSREILTLESQPGLIIYDNDTEYMQKPYLRIGGPAGRIHRILIKLLYPQDDITLDNSVIKYVPYILKELEFWGYDNYQENNQEDDQDYVSVMLGIDTPSFLSSQYTEYVLSNRFFDRIADAVETTP